MSDYHKVIQGTSKGYKIAKLYFNWNNLEKYEEMTYSGRIVKLAEIIDEGLK